MPLIILENISLAYGHHALLDEINLQIDAGERVGLLGRNGEGKSSLLGVILGTREIDGGRIWRNDGLKLAQLAQALPEDNDLTVFEYVAQGLADTGRLLAEYHKMTLKVAQDPNPALLDALHRHQHELETGDGWRLNQRIETALSRLQLPADARLNTLSGGWRRRAALGQALVSEPDLLLLDEPTNHLDIETITWLEDQLKAFNGGLLFVTHDRALLQRLATRIIDLDRGQLTSWPGDYDNYLRRKAEMAAAEEKQRAEFDKKLAREEVWIRQGVKARRTRNEGRVRALKALREEKREQRHTMGKARLKMDEGSLSGRLVIEAKHLHYAIEDQVLVDDFSMRIMRGDRLGLIGPNGIGKTTLLNLLLKEIEPQQGSVRHGTRLQPAYFDQLRAHLNPEASVMDSLDISGQEIEINGRKRHITGYLNDFLFPPSRLRTPVKALSGGERARLLLARLFAKPANLLVLDEPTNDLDIETLELLEELLLQYTGTVLLVSHDRRFLENVITGVLAFAGNGVISEHVGGYEEWQRLNQQSGARASNTAAKPAAKKAKAKSTRQKKMAYKAQRELQQLPAIIESLEAEQQKISQAMLAKDFYQQDAEKIAQVSQRAQEIEQDLQQAYARWEELES